MPKSAFQEIENNLRGLAKSKNIKIESIYRGLTHKYLQGDPQRLKLIFAHILHNAILNSAENQVVIVKTNSYELPNSKNDVLLTI